MKLGNKVKNAVRKFIAQETANYEQDDGYHKIEIAELDFGHIVIDVMEHKTEVTT